MNSQPDFINWLEEKFIEQNEVGGIPITKDNCEDLFENYLESLGSEDIMEWATMYGNQMYFNGHKDCIKSLSVKI